MSLLEWIGYLHRKKKYRHTDYVIFRILSNLLSRIQAPLDTGIKDPILTYGILHLTTSLQGPSLVSGSDSRLMLERPYWLVTLYFLHENFLKKFTNIRMNMESLISRFCFVCRSTDLPFFRIVFNLIFYIVVLMFVNFLNS